MFLNNEIDNPSNFVVVGNSFPLYEVDITTNDYQYLP